MAVPKTGPLSRACPRCKSKPGTPCRNLPSGKTCEPHAARRNPDNPPPAHRPLMLTPELTTEVCNHLALGAPLNMAVAAAGIHIATAYRWLAQADTDDPDTPSLFRDFRDAITQARARGGVQQLARINQAAARHIKSEEPVVDPGTGKAVLGPDGKPLVKRVWEQDWRAAGFILERGFARDFGRREVVELSNGDSVEPVPASAGVAGSDGSGVAAVATSIAAFKARKELEAGELDSTGQPIEDAELVEDGQS